MMDAPGILLLASFVSLVASIAANIIGVENDFFIVSLAVSAAATWYRFFTSVAHGDKYEREDW